MHAEAHAIRAARQARAVEQLVGNVETVGHVVFADIVGIETDGLEQTAERACSGLAVAIHDIAQDHLAIDRISDGLAHFFLVERRVFGIEFEHAQGGRHLIAFHRRIEERVGLHPRKIGVIDGAVAGEMRLAGLERGGARRGIGDETCDDMVEIGQPRLPIFVVAVEPHELSAVPLPEFERPRADRLVGRRILQDLRSLENRFAHDRQIAPCERLHEIGRGIGEKQNRSLFVRRVDAGQLGEQERREGVIFLQDLHEGELDVGARERLAVVKYNAFAQLEGDGLAVGRGLPRCREIGLRILIPVVCHKTFVNLRGDGRDVAGGHGIVSERRGLGLHDHHHRATSHRLIGLGQTVEDGAG